MYKHILVATDGSDLATRALDHAGTLAKTLGSKLTVVMVNEPATLVGGGYASVAGTMIDAVPELIEAQRDNAKRVLDQAVKKLEALGVAAGQKLVENSFPAEGVIATAGEVGADLIVMGSHGRRGVGRLLLGSQTNEVLTHTKIPVLVIR